MNRGAAADWWRRHSAVVDAVPLTAVFVFVLWWRWQGWLDPFTDFGRELYVPWRLSEGAVLYRDVAYHAGPFSAYFNSFVFRLFGPSLNALTWTNIAIAAGVCGLLYQVVRRLADRLAAVVSVLAFELLFLAAQYNYSGNFNWITPYSHEMTHGAGLAIAAVLCFSQLNPAVQSYRRTAVAGGLIGLTFLTKPEFLVAAMAAHVVVVGLWLVAVIRTRERGPLLGRIARQAGCWLGGALVPPAITTLLFAGVIPFREALAATAGAWRYVFGQGNLELSYFQRVMGTDDVGRSLVRLLSGVAMLAAVGLLAVGLQRLVRRRWQPASRWGGGVLVASGLAALVYWFLPGFDRIWRTLPLVAVGVGIAAVAAWCRQQTPGEQTPGNRDAGWRISWAVFAGALLLKNVLYARLLHYGFVLSLPAVLLMVSLAVCWGPAILRRWTAGQDWLLRAILGGFFLGVVAHEVSVIQVFNARMQSVCTWQGQTWRYDERNALLAAALLQADNRIPPASTLTVIPETEFLNFMLKRRSPVRYGNFNPHQVLIYREASILSDFREHPPDYVIVVDRRYRIYDDARFGDTYARDLGRWIHGHYEQAAVLADNPLDGARSPILLLRRRPDADVPVTPSVRPTPPSVPDPR